MKKITAIALSSLIALSTASAAGATEKEFNFIKEERWDYHFDVDTSKKYQEQLKEQNDGEEVGWTTPEALFYSLSETEDIQKKLLEQVKKNIEQNQREKVMLDPTYEFVALTKAKDMYFNQYFDEKSPTYGTPDQMNELFGKTGNKVVQAIYKGKEEPQKIVSAWLDQKPELKEELRKIGISVYGEKGTDNLYWVLYAEKK